MSVLKNCGILYLSKCDEWMNEWVNESETDRHMRREMPGTGMGGGGVSATNYQVMFEYFTVYKGML